MLLLQSSENQEIFQRTSEVVGCQKEDLTMIYLDEEENIKWTLLTDGFYLQSIGYVQTKKLISKSTDENGRVFYGDKTRYYLEYSREGQANIDSIIDIGIALIKKQVSLKDKQILNSIIGGIIIRQNSGQYKNFYVCFNDGRKKPELLDSHINNHRNSILFYDNSLAKNCSTGILLTGESLIKIKQSGNEEIKLSEIHDMPNTDKGFNLSISSYNGDKTLTLEFNSYDELAVFSDVLSEVVTILRLSAKPIDRKHSIKVKGTYDFGGYIKRGYDRLPFLLVTMAAILPRLIVIWILETNSLTIRYSFWLRGLDYFIFEYGDWISFISIVVLVISGVLRLQDAGKKVWLGLLYIIPFMPLQIVISGIFLWFKSIRAKRIVEVEAFSEAIILSKNLSQMNRLYYEGENSK